MFAALRFCLITARAAGLLGGGIPLHRNAARLLERVLAWHASAR